MTLPICFARWWLFYSNMDHMSLRLHLFQLKLERINESPGLSSCYHDTRDKHGNQLWLKEIACRIFPSWLAHTHTREREIIEWQQKIYKNIQTKQKTRKRCKFIHFVHQRSVGETFYHSMMSILCTSNLQKMRHCLAKRCRHQQVKCPVPRTCVARELNASMQQKEKKKKRQVSPEDMKQEVGFYANKRRIPAAYK